MSFSFTPGCCCVTGTTCIRLEDNFTGPDSTTVTDWTEVYGDWEIEGEVLKLLG